MDAELDVVIATGDHSTPETIAERAANAEEHGFSRASMGETTGWNVVPLLTVIAERTDRLGVSTDVLSPFARSPALLAQTALTLHDVSDGRYRLGLGPSSPAITERWHGARFDRPLRRLRETVDVIRAVYAEGNPAYEGQVYDIAGLSYDRSVPENPPPIDLSTLGPKATELAGRFGDGWIPQLFTRDGLENRLEDLERGAELGGRDPAEIRVSPIVRCFAAEDRERARTLARSTVAFLLGAYGPYYGDSVADQGYPEVVSEIRAAWDDRDTQAMAAALPDDVLDDLAAAGAPGEVREWIADYASVDAVDAVRVGFVSGMTEEDKAETLAALGELV